MEETQEDRAQCGNTSFNIKETIKCEDQTNLPPKKRTENHNKEVNEIREEPKQEESKEEVSKEELSKEEVSKEEVSKEEVSKEEESNPFIIKAGVIRHTSSPDSVLAYYHVHSNMCGKGNT